MLDVLQLKLKWQVEGLVNHGLEKVTLRAKPNIKVVAKDLLESQPNGEKEEEHRKEINKNYKWES
jgi:hypothetical protein